MALRRWLSRGSLLTHCVALGLVLLALMAVIDTRGSFGPDEGGYILQTRNVAEEGTWEIPHPAPEADPDRVALPLNNANEVGDGWAAIASHPAQIYLYVLPYRLAGVAGLMLLSLLGTIAAAAAGGLLARRLKERYARPAVWILGLGTPLLFYSYVVNAHTLGAAACGFAALFALRFLDKPKVWLGVGVAMLVAAAILVRSEAFFMGCAIGVVVFAVGIGRRSVPAVLLGAMTGFVAVGTRVAEGRWEAWLVETRSYFLVYRQASFTTLSGRIDGLYWTWFRLGPQGMGVVADLLVLGVLLGIVGLVIARLRPGGTPVVVSVAVLMITISLIGIVLLLGTDLHRAISGLFFACPFIGIGLFALGRLRGDAAILLWISGLFTAAVVATQYDVGGGVEWGGRYFALMLPLLVPVLVQALAQLGRGLEARARHAAVLALVALMAMASLYAVRVLVVNHRGTAAMFDRFSELAASAPGVDRDAPFFVTNSPQLSRSSWVQDDGQIWLTTEHENIPALVERLEAQGYGEPIVVLTHPSLYLTVFLPPYDDLEFDPSELDRSGGDTFAGWRVAVEN